MHDTALAFGRSFFDYYWEAGFTLCVELGACDVNGGLRDVRPAGCHYIGLDLSPGPGVDVVVQPDARLPLADACTDIALASSVFEHDGAFWESFLELCRITRPGGIIYLNAPSNGKVHRFPVDCWRFYPDAGLALARWAGRRGLAVQQIESFVAPRRDDVWNDFVVVFRRGEEARPGHGYLSDLGPVDNLHRHDREGVQHENELTEDMRLVQDLRSKLEAAEARLAAMAAEPDHAEPAEPPVEELAPNLASPPSAVPGAEEIQG